MELEKIVYVIDSDQEMSRSLAALLISYDIGVRRFPDVPSFLSTAEATAEQSICLLLNLDLPHDAGLLPLQQVRERYPRLPVIALEESVKAAATSATGQADHTDFIDKSLASTYLFQRISQLIPGADQVPQTQASTVEMAGGQRVTFRMTHPDDAELQQAFVSALSEKSRYMRFFSGLKKLPEHVLKEFTSPNFPISYAVVAVISDGTQDRQIGVARWAPTGTEGIGEFAVVVADDCQGQGIASQLMSLLVTAATVGGLQRLEGLILKENQPMLAMARKMGFTLCSQHDAGPSIALYIKDLRDSGD